MITAVTRTWDEAQGLTIDGRRQDRRRRLGLRGRQLSGNFAVVRYLTDGQLDTSSAARASGDPPVAEGTRADQGSAVLLQIDDAHPGRPGARRPANANGGSNSDFAVTRYWR